MRKFKYNFDTIPDRTGTGTLKFDAREDVFSRPDVIPMWIADMDFECPPAIGEAIRRRAEHNVYGYDFGGVSCIPSVKGWLARRTGWVVEDGWLRFTTGVVAGLGFAVRAFTEPDDSIVIQTPVYAPFRMMSEVNGRRIVTNPLKKTGEGYEMDLYDLEKKLSEGESGRVGAIILCNPHNPVGRVYTGDELRRVGELCVEHDVTIISDEIHSDLVFAPHKHIHIAALDERFAERCVTFVAPSKTFNIAGLATSAAIIPSEKMRAAWDAEYTRAHIIDGTVFGHIALRAAYDGCEDWLEDLLIYMKSNADYVREFISTSIPSVRTVRLEGTYLMWLDFRALGMSHSVLMKWLAHEAGLGLSSGTDFGREGIGFARLNIATNRATVEKAMRQLSDAVAKL